MLPILRSNRMCSGCVFPGVPGRLAPAWTRFLISFLDAICRSTPVVDATPSVIRHVACCMSHVACRLVELCAESCCSLQAQLWLPNYVLTYARTKAHTSLKPTAARHAARTPIRGHCARTVLGPAGRVWIAGTGPFEACQSFSNSMYQPWSGPSKASHQGLASLAEQ